ncbi:MAG: phycocyanobilin:ferredoxin oxidoreductase [Phormidesmis priestleyi]|uniref:Phycocyanobilin:ferredoxin oxidoreductase n=1 Tax=Phormidesmis priestleyi TaxID=268141 RepID=A0A2W4ZZL4_9CYAN|nr:MAG: phycocyanobilin:ferredoxin oxidoreductase [Phormidesmis priestleyi]
MIQSSRHMLSKQQHPAIGLLAENIKSLWQSQLRVFPYDIPTDLGYVEGSLEGEQLTIENTCYQTLQFRKLHLELAQVGNTLDILHCVMFPHPCFDLPIFGVDIVAARGSICAAIVDLSPVAADRQLPAKYTEALAQLPVMQFAHPRELPAWGDIFSDACLFIRPDNAEEERAFINQVMHYLSIHCQIACETTAVGFREARAAVVAGQRRYCLQQQKNDKTRRILERAFGAAWAQRYLETMLFDVSADEVVSDSSYLEVTA